MEFLKSILACPDCRTKLIWTSDNMCECRECKRIFKSDGKYINLMPRRTWIEQDMSKITEMEKWREIESEFIRENVYNGGISETIHLWGHKTIEDFREYRGNGTYILDLACGTGSHVPYLKKYGNEKLLCLDIEEHLLKTCARIDGAEKISLLIQGDNYFLPFMEKSLDQILSIYTLEHMHDLSRSLSEVYRVLAPEGRFYVAIPTEGLLWRLGRQVTTARVAKKKFGINDYNAIVKLSHVSDAKKILKIVKGMFKIIRIKYFPFLVPSPDLNLIIAFELAKKI